MITKLQTWQLLQPNQQMGNTNTSAEAAKKNIEKYNADPVRQYNNDKVPHDISDTLLGKNFEKNMKELRDRLLSAIIAASELGQSSACIYFIDNSPYNADDYKNPHNYGLYKTEDINKVLEKLRSYPEMKGYVLSEYKFMYACYITGVRIAIQ